MMFIYHFVFLGLLIGTECFFLALDLMNIRYADRKIDENETMLRDQFDVDDTEEVKNYHRLKTGFSRLKSLIGLGALVVFLYAGLFQQFVELFVGIPLDSLYQGILFFMALSVLFLFFNAPFSYFKTFVIEEMFGFNESTSGLWLKDQLKGLLLTLVFSALLSGALLWFIGQFPTTWWLWGWGFFVLFGLFMQIIYPRVIAPMFNEFTPVEEGELHEAVTALFDRAGFTCSDIFTMDASRRSGHSNAYFIGFGRTKRVVLFDTLIDQLNLDEVQGVLAHELAHWKKGHVWKGILRSAVRTGIMLGLVFYLVESSWLYTMFGLSETTAFAGLVLGGLWLGPLGQWLSPLDNWWSIRDEREADAFAVDVMEGGEPLIQALTGLISENLGNPFPHPLYASFHYSHPPIPDRIQHIRESASGDSG